MTAPEDAIDAIAALRRARPQLPDEVVSPASEAAQALLEEILSMHIPEIDLVPTDPVPTDTGPLRPRRSRRPLVLAAATAVAVAGIAAVAAVVATTDDSGGDGDVTVDVGPAADDTTTTLPPVPAADTGRLRVEEMSQWGQVPAMGEDTTTSWSGDDFWIERGLEDSGVVGDRSWSCHPDLDVDASPPEGGASLPEIPYTCDDVVPPRPDRLDIDPAALLDQLAAAGPFTPVGDEDVEGVPTQRRRATNPAATPLDALAFMPIFPDDATVNSLEVWVDGEDRVLRVEVSAGGVGQGQDFTHTISYVWYDLGEPITIEPVAAGDLVDPARLADLLGIPGDDSTTTDPATTATTETEVGG